MTQATSESTASGTTGPPRETAAEGRTGPAREHGGPAGEQGTAGEGRAGPTAGYGPVDEAGAVCVRFHAAIELIGSRWTGAILQVIFKGHSRYAQIRAAVPGLSDTMLAQRLRTLEAERLIERHVLPSSPVQVEYRLTEKGRDLEPVLEAVVTWSHKWIPLP
jgi:DNA-binding HxlR family transcriptional regulator